MDDQANRQYITNKVHPIYENMLVDLIISKPNDVVGFMQKWLKEKGSQFQMLAEAQPHQTLDQLKQQYKKKGVQNEDECSSSSDDDDYADDLLVELEKKKQQNPNGRSSVSAEAFGQFNIKKAFQPKVIAKKPEQKDRILKRIMQSFMFSALDEKERNIVIDAMEEQKFSPNQYIIKQGDDGNCLYVLDEGEASCEKIFKKGEKPVFLKTYIPGESFGELALLYNCPRAATIKAQTNCTLFVLDQETFNHIVKDAAQKKRERYQDFLASVELLKGLDAYERSQIADALKTIKAKKGEYIVTEGEEGDIFFFLEVGKCDALKKIDGQQKVVKSYKPGDYFGELALLKNQPRQASIVCTEDCVLVALDRYTFKRLLGNMEEILKQNAQNY
ncbi:Cyclic nucleotide-binding protein [Pseudocohnilembus persalinus]|uniref:cAMP-dependent protein kinase regulatory subunit n=1 Tax=Pseudocohnilembus persalinus TaxID=266149 RepID=A0A0V0QTQ8_PSEPJ|nr:Cyclic nucleotide-binding protein [Pseudocohnilembus persalinus]|eukprot:KRX05579.1 Cyclic nucleotide-binding protein [Pseudocohnilembus persalinus]